MPMMMMTTTTILVDDDDEERKEANKLNNSNVSMLFFFLTAILKCIYIHRSEISCLPCRQNEFKCEYVVFVSHILEIVLSSCGARAYSTKAN